MRKSYKTEIEPTQEQIQTIHRTIGVCRYVYNFYLSHNKEVYEKEKKFVSGMDFSKWLNHVYLLENPEKAWIKEVSSKSVKQSIMNAEKAFQRFFNHQSGFPRCKNNYQMRKTQDKNSHAWMGKAKRKRLYSSYKVGESYKKWFCILSGRKILCVCVGRRKRAGKTAVK